LHAWEVAPEEARQLQQSLRDQLIFSPLHHFDVVRQLMFPDDRLYAAVVVMRLPDFRLVEIVHAERSSTFP
jgi:hypothetical protein